MYWPQLLRSHRKPFSLFFYFNIKENSWANTAGVIKGRMDFFFPNKNNIYPSALSAVADRLVCYCQLLSEKFRAGSGQCRRPALLQAAHSFPCCLGWFVSFSVMVRKAPKWITGCALISPMNMERNIHPLRAQRVFLFRPPSGSLEQLWRMLRVFIHRGELDVGAEGAHGQCKPPKCSVVSKMKARLGGQVQGTALQPARDPRTTLASVAWAPARYRPDPQPTALALHRSLPTAGANRPG